MILGGMPVRIPAVFAAKLAALGAALGLAVVAVNSFTGLVCPFLIVPGAWGALAAARDFGAFWLVILLASVFVFLLLLGIQGVTLHLLPHALCMRWSSLIQTVAFFAVLTLYFLTPPLATPHALAAPENRLWYALVALVAAATYALAYARQMRRAVEQSGIAPGFSLSSRGITPWAAIALVLARRGPERAILVFIGRTLARSRQHGLLLAVYAGMGLAYVFSQVAYVLYHSRATGFGALEGHTQTALGIPLILLFFLVPGLRVSFSIPIEVRANWLFHLTDPNGRGAYLDATRKTLLLLVLAPVVAIVAPIYHGRVAVAASVEPCGIPRGVWSAGYRAGPYRLRQGALHSLVSAGQGEPKDYVRCVLGLLIIVSELNTTTLLFAQPTACLRTRLSTQPIPSRDRQGADAQLLMTLCLVTYYEEAALRSPAGYAWLIGVTLLAWLAAAWRGRGVRARIRALSFEEQPEPAVVGLGLAGRG